MRNENLISKNDVMKISLDKRSIENGNKWSWYIQFYYGSKINDKGKRNHIRDFKYLKIYTFQNPTNAEEEDHNIIFEKLAKEIFSAEEIKHLNSGTITTKKNLDFIESTKNDINYAIDYLIKNSSSLTEREINKLSTIFNNNDFLLNVLEIKFMSFTESQKQKLFAAILPLVSKYIKLK